MTTVTFPDTPSALKTLLMERGLRPRKHLGQNFLVDQNLLRVIVEEAAVGDRDIILEVGSGTGLLTKHLAERAHRVLAVEIDPRLYGLTMELLQGYTNVHFLNKDVLKTKTTIDPEIEAVILQWLNEEKCRGTLQRAPTIKVVSNLPYSISTPFIIAILTGGLPVECMVLTLQRDIVDRLLAYPGTKEYGVLSVIAQLFSDVELLRQLPPEVFWPVPQVESAIVRMTVRRERAFERIPDLSLFNRLVMCVFQSRRKTLINSLLKLGLPSLSKEAAMDVLKGLGLEPRIRGEALDPEGFTALLREIHLLTGGSTTKCQGGKDVRS
ncbi:MAG: 16S rRNA (adenine(1518)-N(6)/adenine(1519)-N(6))-dimethyltransferase RsmA [Candidatus Brocadiaceae bacterium]|nr:16S rRNA (adenine(1518)-N(6)/adenine(1519)-N(6))-dimethyltransferase RsmA [Candidatus Brocadiaceae bacterium]